MIALITNLPNNENFLKFQLETTDSKLLMSATGGNTGNVAFVHAVQSILADTYEVIDWSTDPKIVREKYSKIVVCCANQIGSHVDLCGWGDRLDAFGLPVVLIGLGAQSNEIGIIPEVPRGTIEFLKVVERLRTSEGESNIITRGEFSTSVLKHFGFDSSPFGCPSLLTSNKKNLGQLCLKNQNRNFKRVMVPSGNPFHPSSVIEQKLVDLVNKYDGEYVLQHPHLIFSLLLDSNPDIDEHKLSLIKRVYPKFDKIDNLVDWLKAKSVFFADAPNWLNYSKKFTSAIGPRYHGIALPIQVGVPGKVIAIDSRTEELSYTTGIPFLKFKDVIDMEVDDLYQASLWNKEDADKLDFHRLVNNQNYIKFMESNELKPREHLLRYK
jgi:hypothetical protein